MSLIRDDDCEALSKHLGQREIASYPYVIEKMYPNMQHMENDVFFDGMSDTYWTIVLVACPGFPIGASSFVCKRSIGIHYLPKEVRTSDKAGIDCTKASGGISWTGLGDMLSTAIVRLVRGTPEPCIIGAGAEALTPSSSGNYKASETGSPVGSPPVEVSETVVLFNTLETLKWFIKDGIDTYIMRRIKKDLWREQATHLARYNSGRRKLAKKSGDLVPNQCLESPCRRGRTGITASSPC